MARGKICEAHHHLDLVPIEKHHVWPLGYHGPDIESNKTPLCANAHSDVHYLLEAMLKNKQLDHREFGQGVRNVAKRGYDQIIAYGKHLSHLQVQANHKAEALAERYDKAAVEAERD